MAENTVPKNAPFPQPTPAKNAPFPQPTPDDPHLSWAASLVEFQALRALARDAAERNQLDAAIVHLQRLIGSTRAKTLAGARVQVLVVAEEVSAVHALALENAVATLDELAGEVPS